GTLPALAMRTLPPPPAVVPAVSSVTMGYGHLRAAHAIADACDATVLHADRPPFAEDWEVRHWARIRSFYESLSRATAVPFAGRAMQSILDGITAIPRPARAGELAAPSLASRYMASLVERGFGEGIVRHVRDRGVPLVATFYAQAIVADARGHADVVCVVTDADVNRVWAPACAEEGAIRYAAPTARAARRLLAFGVPPERVHRTGFPLPHSLLGDDDVVARRRLAARLVRLDPRGAFLAQAPAQARRLRDEADPADVAGPLLVAFAIGGAGAQGNVARDLVHGLREPLARGEVRLVLVAGVREDTAKTLADHARGAGFEPAEGAPVEVLLAPDVPAYLDRFHALLGAVDLLWTKPSEITFFAATGLPIVLAPPLGVQERANRAWGISRGAALDGDARDAARFLRRALDDGSLARAAWNGFTRLPRHGTRRILELLRRGKRG
ncbi:MAG TPA: hypothetical protein VND21_03190, partial [Planctomycetota bacterium]|nr:hypothetical protein [Planctomycetota bacterium]